MENKETLFEKVLHLFLRFGIRSLTMDDISRELGISKKTLYEQVEDKSSLVHRIIELELAGHEGCMTGAEQPGSNAIDDLITINDRMQEMRRNISPAFYFDLRKYYPEIYRSWVSEKHLLLQNLITGNIEKGKSAGIYRSNLNGEVIARIYIYLVTGMAASGQVDDPPGFPQDFIHEVFRYHLHGICNQQGLRYLEKLQINRNI